MNDFEAEGRYLQHKPPSCKPSSPPLGAWWMRLTGPKTQTHIEVAVMTKNTDPAVDAALFDYKQIKALVRDAKIKCPVLMRQLGCMPTENLACTAENIRLLKERKRLLDEMDVYSSAYLNGAELLRNATYHLRFANGVNTECYIDRRIGELVLLRLAQGYSLKDVALMIGCSDSAVSNIKAGRYRYSDKPENLTVGARGRKKPIYKPFDRAIEPSN